MGHQSSLRRRRARHGARGPTPTHPAGAPRTSVPSALAQSRQAVACAPGRGRPPPPTRTFAADRRRHGVCVPDTPVRAVGLSSSATVVVVARRPPPRPLPRLTTWSASPTSAKAKVVAVIVLLVSFPARRRGKRCPTCGARRTSSWRAALASAASGAQQASVFPRIDLRCRVCTTMESVILEEDIDENASADRGGDRGVRPAARHDAGGRRPALVARAGLKAPLPEHWKPCKTTDGEVPSQLTAPAAARPVRPPARHALPPSCHARRGAATLNGDRAAAPPWPSRASSLPPPCSVWAPPPAARFLERRLAVR